MKKQIRQGVFETNSSSVHSISIINDNYKPNNLPQEFIIRTNSEFGWEVDTYDSPQDKAAYLYQAIVDYDPRENNSNLLNDEILKIKQNLLNTFINNLESFGIKVICEHKFAKIIHSPNYEYITFINENNEESKGYLDHGGEAKHLVDFVLSSKENTLKFIFDNRCYIDTGNDNDDVYGDGICRNYGDSTIIIKGN